jgi:hypothetical protein
MARFLHWRGREDRRHDHWHDRWHPHDRGGEDPGPGPGPGFPFPPIPFPPLPFNLEMGESEGRPGAADEEAEMHRHRHPTWRQYQGGSQGGEGEADFALGGEAPEGHRETGRWIRRHGRIILLDV